jgi:hypothetical protein
MGESVPVNGTTGYWFLEKKWELLELQLFL